MFYRLLFLIMVSVLSLDTIASSFTYKCTEKVTSLKGKNKGVTLLLIDASPFYDEGKFELINNTDSSISLDGWDRDGGFRVHYHREELFIMELYKSNYEWEYLTKVLAEFPSPDSNLIIMPNSKRFFTASLHNMDISEISMYAFSLMLTSNEGVELTSEPYCINIGK